MLRLVVSYKLKDAALMMEAVSTCEKSVNFYETTRRNIPEDSHLHTRHREHLKSQQVLSLTVEVLTSVGEDVDSTYSSHFHFIV
jgi:hypothetical protein